jgi:hypothetical protein
MAMYKNIVAVMAKMSSFVTAFNFSDLSYLILFTYDPCFSGCAKSLCIFITKLSHVHIQSRENYHTLLFLLTLLQTGTLLFPPISSIFHVDGSIFPMVI